MKYLPNQNEFNSKMEKIQARVNLLMIENIAILWDGTHAEEGQDERYKSEVNALLGQSEQKHTNKQTRKQTYQIKMSSTPKWERYKLEWIFWWSKTSPYCELALMQKKVKTKVQLASCDTI